MPIYLENDVFFFCVFKVEAVELSDRVPLCTSILKTGFGLGLTFQNQINRKIYMFTGEYTGDLRTFKCIPHLL